MRLHEALAFISRLDALALQRLASLLQGVNGDDLGLVEVSRLVRDEGFSAFLEALSHSQDASLAASALDGISRSSLLERPLRELVPALGFLADDEIRPEQASRRLFNLLARHDARSWDVAARLTLAEVLSWRNAGLKTARELWSLAVREGLRVAAEHQILRAQPVVSEDGSGTAVLNASEAETGYVDHLPMLDAIERISAWAAGERQVARLADALKLASTSTEDLPPEIQRAVSRLEALDLQSMGGRYAATYDPAAAGRRVLASLDERLATVLMERTLSRSRPPTLEELGNRFGVTRERARQMEVRAVERLRSEVAKPENQVLERCADRLRARLGRVNRHEVINGALLDLGIGQDETFSGRLLLWLAGPYMEFDEWVTRGKPDEIVKDSLTLLASLTRDGPVDVDDSLLQLEKLEIEDGLRREWVAGLKRYRFLDNYLVPWAGSVGDKAEAVLRIHGRPMTREEILQVIAEPYSRGTLSNCLLGEPRFLRRGLEHFGLAEWGGEEYTSIVDEITQEIERQGGEAELDYLVSALSTAFGVSPKSVRSYATSQQFVRTSRGTLRLRSANDALPRTRAIESTRGCFFVNHVWTYQIPVNGELLRGSGLALPPGFVTHIGVDPGGSIECNSDFGPIRFAWPSMQPRVSSLRKVAEALSATDGDFINIAVRDEFVSFTVIRQSVLASLTGQSLVLCRLGISAEEDDPLGAVAQALGLDASSSSFETVRRRLRARGEDDLVTMLPGELEEPADPSLSLDELLKVLAGRRE